VHPSAIVLSDEPLSTLLPARAATGEDKKRIHVTQAEMHQVEDQGFPKFDLLVLKTLDHLVRAAELTGLFADRREIVRFFWDELDVYNDVSPKAYQLITDKATLGLFQIDDNPAPRDLGKELRPESIDDLALIVALNNPGPQRSGTVKSYLRRRKDQEGIEYETENLATLLDPILSKTEGLFVYQEQVITLAKKLKDKETGESIYTPSDADHFRKTMGKRDFVAMAILKSGLDADGKPVELKMPTWDQAMERAGFNKWETDSLYEKIKDFSLYGFNEAHAVEYATVLAWTLYAKAEWRTEFIIAGIEVNPEQVEGYVEEAAGLGIRVLPPDVNGSGATIDKGGPNEIIYGLRDIKGIGQRSAEWVVAGQPWEHPDNLLAAIDAADRPPFNLGHFRTLTEAGAFDSFGYRLTECGPCGGKGRVATMVPKKNPADGMKKAHANCEICQGSTFAESDIPGEETRKIAEKKLLGVVLTGADEAAAARARRAEALAEAIERNRERLDGLTPLSEVRDEPGDNVKVGGVITEVRPTKTKNGALPMGFITVARGEDEVSFVAFPGPWEEYGWMLKPNTLGEFTLKPTERGAQLVKGWSLT
jgi:DNA polymerase-3 subunit alpha